MDAMKFAEDVARGMVDRPVTVCVGGADMAAEVVMREIGRAVVRIGEDEGHPSYGSPRFVHMAGPIFEEPRPTSGHILTTAGEIATDVSRVFGADLAHPEAASEFMRSYYAAVAYRALEKIVGRPRFHSTPRPGHTFAILDFCLGLHPEAQVRATRALLDAAAEAQVKLVLSTRDGWPLEAIDCEDVVCWRRGPNGIVGKRLSEHPTVRCLLYADPTAFWRDCVRNGWGWVLDR